MPPSIPAESAVHVDLNAAENSAILDYLQSVNEHRFPAFFELEEEDRWYVFWRRHKPGKFYGCHPDAFDQLFDVVARDLDGAAYRVVYGRDCLIHPRDGRILGFCQGMCYALKLDPGCMPAALAAHDRALGTMHPGMRPNVEAWASTVRGIARDWMPGRFVDDEARWFAESWGRADR